MSAVLLMLVSFAVLFLAYRIYGRWLANKWGVDPRRLTPAHQKQDGVDYVPAKAPVLLGHHFASIAGASAISGPILAASFGWLPVLLWILLGGIFFGAVQDFGALFASVRHGGKSVGHIVEANIGKQGKKMFLVFAWFTLLLVVASFTDIVVNTFTGLYADGSTNAANGATASTSVLFILVSVAFGFVVYRRKVGLLPASIAGIAVLAACVAIGSRFPLYLSKEFWLVTILVYIFIAAISPVWLLLQPRDYLNSFLLYTMILAAFFGIIMGRPTLELEAFTGFDTAVGPMFPMLFITVACGAISGFHSLVGSGTTAKQLDREQDARLIGYGGMLIESGLAVVALLAVAAFASQGDLANETPANVFANAVAGFTLHFNIPTDLVRTLIALSISAFSLTSLDTCTRLGRYMLQELFSGEGEGPGRVNSFMRLLAGNRYAATAVTVALAGALAMGGYETIWTLFGSANQLLAALALMAVAVWLDSIGKNNKMFYVPTLFMLAAALSALLLSVKNNITSLMSTQVQSFFYREILQLGIALLLLVMAVVLSVQCASTMLRRHKKEN